MNRSALFGLVLSLIPFASTYAEQEDPQGDGHGELAADLQLLQGTWELLHGDDEGSSPTVRSVKAIVGNRETVRRYRHPSGELMSEHTVEFALTKSGGVRVFTFFPVGKSPKTGQSYVYKVGRNDFFDIPGILNDKSLSNYQTLPKVWHWKRVSVGDDGDSTPPLTKSPSNGGTPQWGVVVDPDNDCDLTANSFSMRVPPTNHDLNPLRGSAAPRVLRPVDGDFDISVKVTADFKPGTTATGKGRPFNGAGILIWQNEYNFLRVERNAWWDGESFQCYPPLIEYWHERRYSGANEPSVESAEFFRGDATWLKAVRRGRKVMISLSHDGKDWIDMKTIDVDFSGRLQVGVAGVNTSDKPFHVTFDDLKFDLKP